MIFYKSEDGAAPQWMKNPHQRDYTHFYAYCENDALSWPAPGADWLPLTDSVSFIQLGDFSPQLRETFTHDIEQVLTPCGSSVPLYPAVDKTGTVWPVPMILSADGPTLALTWSTVNGSIVRQPSEQQRQIIETCQSLRDSFLSDSSDDIPMDVAAHAAGMIMAYGYHVHDSEFLRHGFLDDHLVPRILMAACGLGTAEHHMDDA